jgi:hypothetical protein
LIKAYLRNSDKKVRDLPQCLRPSGEEPPPG